ncbi:MAG TPA: fumarylacetoacetate hydrolase family protein [Rhizomicrobium sp.]|nr:fumarylacetoacetate hydrolase family protein [Rhizomicrobium sp.]
MSDFVFAPPATPSLSIAGTAQRFAVRRIWCVGRNYAAHARELGNDEREPPFFFSKQPDMLVPGGGDIAYPGLTENLHYEGELVVALKGGGQDVPPEKAAGLIFGYAPGIDMTRRDLQKRMQEKGKPWEIGKSFEQSAPVGTITPSSRVMDAGAIRLAVNGEVRQDSDLSNMIWSVAEIIARLSQQVSLATGDIIFTGTPEGVGAVVRGDRLRVEIGGLGPLDVTIA